VLDLERIFGQAGGEHSTWRRECDNGREALRRTVRIRAELDDLERALVRRLRREYALTWHELGDDLGVTGQTAHRRHARALRR
jgi:hypothetical protein